MAAEPDLEPKLAWLSDVNHADMMQIGGETKEGCGRSREGISLWNGGAVRAHICILGIIFIPKLDNPELSSFSLFSLVKLAQLSIMDTSFSLYPFPREKPKKKKKKNELRQERGLEIMSLVEQNKFLLWCFVVK